MKRSAREVIKASSQDRKLSRLYRDLDSNHIHRIAPGLITVAGIRIHLRPRTVITNNSHQHSRLNTNLIRAPIKCASNSSFRYSSSSSASSSRGRCTSRLIRRLQAMWVVSNSSSSKAILTFNYSHSRLLQERGILLDSPPYTSQARITVMVEIKW